MQNLDLDLEKIEEVLQEAKTSKKRDSKGRHRDHSSDHSQKKKKKKHHHKRSRSKSKKDKKRRSSKSSSSTDSKRNDKKKRKRHRSRSSSSSSSIISENSDQLRERQIREKIKEEEEKKKQLENEIKQQEYEEARRDDCTVLMLQLPLKITEKEIYQFLLKGDCGKIRDIRIIKDTRTGKSKGIAYIEFFYQQSVFKAVALNSQLLGGFPVKIQPSQAEKNRISLQLPKNKNKNVNRLPIDSQDGGPMRIYIGNLTEQLADITEQDIDKLFSQFGSIEFIDLHRDSFTGKCKGFAFVQYYNLESAKQAIKQMNGFNINGKQIKVSTVTQNFTLQPGVDQLQQVQTNDLDDEYGQNYLHSSESRALLMQKLTRQDISGQTNQIQNTNQVNILQMKNDIVPNQPQIFISKIPSTIILLTNMFKLEEMVKDMSQFQELQEDIEYECKKFGKLEKLHLDQKSLYGNVWVIYNDVQSAIQAFNTLNMRIYNGLQILAYFVPENVFKKQFAQFLL